ncbi:Hypothetical predicted protein, partial [Paramuricea clavata]
DPYNCMCRFSLGTDLIIFNNRRYLRNRQENPTFNLRWLKRCEEDFVATYHIVVASDDGEEVLFTKFKEKDNFMGRPDEGPNESISSIGVALSCALAAAILGTAAIVFVTRRILKSRSTVNYEILREPLRHETKKYQFSS